MKMFRKQTARAPLTTVLLVLLLALSIAASSIGFAAWVGAGKQYDAIDGQYTTIAVPSGTNYQKMYESGTVTYLGADSAIFDDGTKYIGAVDARLCAERSEYFKSASNGIFLNAYIAGTTALTSGSTDILNYHASIDEYCYALSVLAVRCKSVEIVETDYSDLYSVTFDLIDPVCRMEIYDLPPYEDEIVLFDDIMTRDGKVPFEVGRTYLIRGLYGDYPITLIDTKLVPQENGRDRVEMIYGRSQRDEWTHRVFSLESGSAMQQQIQGELGVAPGPDNHVTEQMKYPDSNKYYQTTPNGCWPYYAEYEGDWRDFLASDDGTVWREEIIPNFEKNHASASVVLTDDLDSMYLFNTGDASILEGRSFEKAEYQQGEAVCLVSAAYAEHNGLKIGDTLNIDYYDTGYDEITYAIPNSMGRIGMTVQRFPLTADSHLGIQKDYTIVGIYTAPEWSPGAHNFHADTIFVPKASVPGIALRTERLQFLHSIIIENGSIDAFEAHMAANDKAGAYLYFDQGYTEAAATVQTLIDNAMRLMLVGVAMFLLASMLFLLLFARRVSAVMRSMRLLGVPKKGVWLESLGMLVMQEVIAVLLGNGLAVILYDRITAQLLSGTPALDPVSIALCAGVQLAVLVAAGGVWMHRIAGSNLMQKSEGGKLLWNKNKAASFGA